MTQRSTQALAAALGRALLQQRWRAVTAESCTGGLVAGAITDVPGSSGWFERGFVTYSNEAKTELLGVPAALIALHGAVSEEVARAMAEGALARSVSDIAVAVTGIAGPDGGTLRKPVGTVCFAFARKGSTTQASTHHLGGDRQQVRAASVAIALQGLLDLAGDKSGETAGSPH